MTREEALKQIREWDFLNDEERAAFETLIPELAESEDERIRKVIIEHFKQSETEFPGLTFGGYYYSDVLAYLEKQKENLKSADSIPSDCVSDAKCEDKSPKHSDSYGTDIRDTPAYWKGWDDAMKQKEQNHPKGCFTCDEYKKGYEIGRLNGFTAGYNKAMKEVDQKEQKPWKVGANAYFTPEQKPEDRFEEAREKYQVEWNEEDRKMIDHLIEALPMWANGQIAMLPSQAEEYVERLKSLRPQPTQEWSEEDEKLFWGFTAYVPEEELKRLGVTRDGILMKLKSIRSQPIQLKEAYKDGFDTARHATALAFMNYCDKIRPNGKMCLSNGECEDIEKAFLVGDWEKIERYFHKCHWKPTKNQLDALNLVIMDYTEDGCIATANYLQEISAEIKKL